MVWWQYNDRSQGNQRSVRDTEPTSHFGRHNLPDSCFSVHFAVGPGLVTKLLPIGLIVHSHLELGASKTEKQQRGNPYCGGGSEAFLSWQQGWQQYPVPASKAQGWLHWWSFWTSSGHDLEIVSGCIISEPDFPIFLSKL